MYTEANQGRFPATLGGADGVWLLRGAFISDKDPNGPQDSFHHFHTKDIICCPVATQPGGRSTFAGGGTRNSFGQSYRIEGTKGSAFNAWEIRTPAPSFHGSYGLNRWLFKGFHLTFLDTVMVRHGRIDLDVLSLRGRDGIPVLLDGMSPGSDPRDIHPPPSEGESDHASTGIQDFCMNRHNGFVNGLFLDWSVRKVGVKELWTLNWYTEFNRAGRWTTAGGMKRENWPRWMRKFQDY
jgi:prepilin-type processing-associated H-X9-DG protein